jgi:hypothetical protein
MEISMLHSDVIRVDRSGTFFCHLYETGTSDWVAKRDRPLFNLTGEAGWTRSRRL